MKRTILAILATLAVSGAFACAERPGATTGPSAAGLRPSNITVVGGGAIFGPQLCLRATGEPQDVSFTFSGADGGTADLIVTDNGVQGLNGTITLNGVEVVSHPMLGGNSPVNDTIPITTLSSNTLVCTLEGMPGSGLTMTVMQ